MQILSAHFVKGIIGTDPILEEDRLQVAFVGRSNVGKSSLINSLCKRKNLVKVSSTPGKTKEINFFLINGEYYFVDLPGYGYAHVSHKDQEHLRERIVWYLTTDEISKRKVVLVLDIKVGVTEFDQEVIDILVRDHIPFILIANKADNVKANEQKYAVQAIREAVHDVPDVPIVLYSSETGIGRNELTNKIFE